MTREAIPELLDPKVDFVFKALFGAEGNKDLLISLLNDVLGRPEGERLVSVELLPTETIKDCEEGKRAVLDIRARDQKGRLFDVEVQCASQTAFPERVLYYWAKLFVEQLGEGQPYGVLRPVISVIFVDFNLVRMTQRYHSSFWLRERDQEIRLTEHLEIHILELPKFDRAKGAREGLERWMAFLKEGKRMREEERRELKDPELKKAYQELERLSRDPKMRSVYESRMKWIRDQEQIRMDAEAEGRAEGRAEGIAEGMQRTRVALRMLREGKSNEEICQATGLVQTEVEGLREDIG